MLHRVIALLGSDAHRAKALEVIKTVSGRIKAGNAVLPVDLLVKALKGETSSAFEKNFAMVFLEMGWRRSPPEQLGLLAPDLLRGGRDSHPPTGRHIPSPLQAGTRMHSHSISVCWLENTRMRACACLACLSADV